MQLMDPRTMNAVTVTGPMMPKMSLNVAGMLWRNFLVGPIFFKNKFADATLQ